MNRENETRKVSKSTAKRLPGYLRILKKLIDGNEFRVSSTHLASLLGASPSQVRQDLSSLGEFGLRGYGYDARVLYTSILDIAGVREEYSAVIIGTEEMVSMLKSRPVFVGQGVALKKCFSTANEITLVQFENYVKKERPDIVVLATDGGATEKAIEIIKSMKIKGVWNFSNVKIKLDVPVKNLWIDDSLMTLCYDIGKKETKERKAK